jgi:hypothetical protein
MDTVRETPTEPVDYAAISAGYGALVAAVLLAARRAHAAEGRGSNGDEPIRATEIIPLGAATFALSKLIAKEKVDTWVREPFLEELPTGERRPKGRRLRYAVGELLSCSRCVGAWSSLALVGLRLTRPREARVVTALLGTSALNDFLHVGFTHMCASSNAAQQQAQAPPAEAGTSLDPRFARESSG